MTVRLAGRSALVTGSSRGIGRAIAEALARDGAAVTINHGRPDSAAEAAEVVATIEAAGGRAQSLCADVADPDDVARLVDAAAAFGGGLDIVVANAGGSAPFAPIATTSLDDWDRVTLLNQRALFVLLAKAASTVRDGGRIVVTSSSMTASPYAGTAVYAGAKAAAETYVRVLAIELGARGITVNAVAPGLTDTAAMRAVVPDDRVAMVVARTPLGRLGRPDDIADVVAFLASDEARWITGQVVRAGGGIA
jgi:3-oxoacyl-[acyl-carrier protein] reductase